MGVIEGRSRSATARAAADGVIDQDLAFAGKFIAHLLAQAVRVEADLLDQLFNSSEKRLARLLLLTANFGKEAKPEPLIAKISQETLADDRNDPGPSEFFHEQISRAGLH